MTNQRPDNDIRKSDLDRFLGSLRENAHPLYTLLLGAPETVFRIIRENHGPESAEQTYSLREYHAQRDRLDDKETFRINFNAYFFRDEWDEQMSDREDMDTPFDGETTEEINYLPELNTEAFEAEAPRLLACLCRKAILANAPLEFDEATVARYGFTPEDVAALCGPVGECNRRIIDELRAQYDVLAAIDCLHEEGGARKETPAPGTAETGTETATGKNGAAGTKTDNE